MTQPIPTDEEFSELARAAASSDAVATERLFLLLLPRVRNLVRYLVRGDRDVDDLSQEALLMILRGIRSYRGEGTFRSWSDRIVARCVFARKRRANLALLDEDDLLARGAEIDSNPALPAPDSFTVRREIVDALDQLPDQQRDALVLHHAVGFTIPELAKELGASEETVRSRLRLGKAKLREQLDGVPSRMVG